MDRGWEDLWGGVLMLALFVMVGIPVALGQLDGASPVQGPDWLWWCCYLAYFVAFLMVFWDHAIPGLTPLRAALAMSAAAIATFVLAPEGWNAILLVFAAATAAHVAPRWVTTVIVAVHVLVMAVVWGFDDGYGWELPLGVAMYGGIHAMTVWAVWLQVSETAARERLAVANTELRAATAMLAESSRSNERLRISRELHDVVGHQLTALALELEVAGHRAEGPAAVHVERARGIAKGLLHDVRATVGELRDRQPQLAEALTSMTADLPRPRVHVEVDEDLPLDEEQLATLVRCAQETITNAIRHADAANLWIAVTAAADGRPTLIARDDGRGAPGFRPGNGLTGLRERVDQVGGEVEFVSGGGFRVEVRLPARVSGG